MAEPVSARVDTPAWIFQVWASFFISVVLAAVGTYHLPVENWLKGYFTMGLFFSVSSSFTLAKTVRDNRDVTRDTGAWIMQTWASFVIAILLVVVGLWNLPVDTWVRGYVAVVYFFVLASSFTLSKTIRDNDEARKQHAIGTTATKFTAEEL